MKNANLQKGFTLVEVIVSTIVILVVFELCFLEVTALQISKKQRYEDVAYQVANKKMEQLRATSFSSLPSSGTITDALLSQIPSGIGNFTVVSGYSGYA